MPRVCVTITVEVHDRTNHPARPPWSHTESVEIERYRPDRDSPHPSVVEVVDEARTIATAQTATVVEARFPPPSNSHQDHVHVPFNSQETNQ